MHRTLTIAVVGLVAVVGCRRDAADQHAEVAPAGPNTSDARAAKAVAGQPRAGIPRVDINGQPYELRTIVGTTRGGEAVTVKMSTAVRTCADLFDGDGITLASDEVLVELELAPPVISVEDVGSPGWDVIWADWPGGISSGRDPMNPRAKSATIVQVPDGLAARGGTLTLHFEGDFHVGAGSPHATLLLDGGFAVKPCGDRPRAALSALQPITVGVANGIGTRALPIRGAVVVPSKDGPRVELGSLPMSCPEHGSGTSGEADVEIDLTVEANRSSRVYVHGALVDGSLNWQPGNYHVTADGPWSGSGPITIAIDGDGDAKYLPLAIHGKVTAERCPP